jgi:hypothetical protein
MSANFSNIRLRYVHTTVAATQLEFNMNLNSLNLELSQNTIGPGLPFSAEFTFDARLEKPVNQSIEQLASIAKSEFGYDPKLGACEVFRQLLVEQVFIGDNIVLDFETFDAISQPAGIPAIVQNSISVHANGDDCCEESPCKYSVRVSFIFANQASGPIVLRRVAGSPPPMSQTLMFPVLNISNELSALDGTDDEFSDRSREFFRLKYEPDAFSIDSNRLSSDRTAATNAIASAIVNGLSGPVATSLQPYRDKPTNDLALWAIIRKGADGLSFKNYMEYMNFIFCGGPPPTDACCPDAPRAYAERINASRALPFMNVDAYRAVKVASEAFVMVNCMVHGCFSDEDMEDLTNRVPLVNGNFSATELNAWWADYREQVNGGPHVIPYYAAILRKMGDETYKNTTLEGAFDSYLGGAGQQTTEKCYGVLTRKLTCPCFLELIWSYWHEESMMVQGINAILRRFQNIKGPQAIDPLANLEIDPLRPLNNIIWGLLQDQQHLLTVRRRAYEYDHHYGITLKGGATQKMRFADSRSKFIEAFHTLLNLASRFFKQADDMTVVPDGFPVLNALKETHLILSEGAHNQWGDLPSTARAEMLMQQWILARPEFREFLPGRTMVAYPEPWMDKVSSINNMMGWTNISVLQFNYLAVYGEKIMLSIRFGNWADPGITAAAASNWAKYWRSEIQGYIHAYRAATGVDLSADGVGAGKQVDAHQPSVHLQRRLQEQSNSRKNGVHKAAYADMDDI